MTRRNGSKSSGQLAQYNAKRNFAVSPEPRGRATKDHEGKQRIFCVQKHLASHLHYDFRLEHNGTLLSWAVPKGPSLNPKDKRLAMRVEDHPKDYADFEGVIPEGYGAGIVMLWDKGTWQPEPGFENVDAALEDGELKFRIDGVKLKGSWVLIRTQSDGYPDGRTWLLIKHRDEWAGDVDVTEAADQSVKSFGDFASILANDQAKIWPSHRPGRGGASGKMMAEIIEQAAELKRGGKTKAVRGRSKSGKGSGRAGAGVRSRKGTKKATARSRSTAKR
jgi:bifunctional non-homologous end joining protein LigD